MLRDTATSWPRRGSVIPLFIGQLQAGRPLTLTDPNMTRFMMSLDDAVDLVVYAFQNGNPGDLFVQKAPAATIGTLADAVQRVFGVAGNRSGDRDQARREALRDAADAGRDAPGRTTCAGYFRVSADNRDLNYAKYFSEGEPKLSEMEDYNSHNTRRLERGGHDGAAAEAGVRPARVAGRDRRCIGCGEVGRSAGRRVPVGTCG